MKHLINMRPSGIAWENEDVVFVTRAGVAHTSQGEIIRTLGLGWDKKEIASKVTNPLSENFVVVEGNYHGVLGYDINVVNKEEGSESYVSFVSMAFQAETVAEFEACYGLREAENPDRYRRIHDAKDNSLFIGGVPVNARADTEMRVYKDRTAAILIRITYGHGTDAETERYFALRPKIAAHAYISDYVRALQWMDPSCADPASADPYLEDVAEIRDESEIRKYAFKWANQSAKTLSEFLSGSVGRELKSHDGDRCPNPDAKFDMVYNNYVGCYFPTGLRKEINAFFGIDLPENSDAKAIFDAKCLSLDWYRTRTKEDGIASPGFLDKWLGLKPKSAAAEKKRLDDDNALWSSIHWGEKSEGNRFITWERREIGGSDFIIASYRDFTKSPHYDRAAFVYDVKRRTRRVLIPADSVDDECKSIIPSLGSAILGKFNMNPTREWDYSKRDYVELDDGPKQVIIGGLSIKELFAGTNIGWILENEKEFGDDMYYLFPKDATSYWWGDADSIRIRKIQEDLADGVRIGQIALCILATTGKPVMEQLLKSRMFRLYFLAVYGEAKGDNGFFWDVSKKVADRYDYCAFPYTSKGKNLKEMFGMSLNQLRMCDKAVDIEKGREDGRERFVYRTPRLGYVAECLGVERLSDIDDALFAKVIAMTKAEFPQNSGFWRPADAKTVFSASVTRGGRIKELLKNNTPKERVAFLASIPSYESFCVMTDYLDMRKQMARRQEESPEKDIFDEREFPAKVGKSVKFIRFMPGMAAKPAYSRKDSFTGESIDNQGEFVKYLRAKYLPYATEKGSVQLEINERGSIVGAIVKMNPTQHMSFLHDELCQWYNILGEGSGDKGKAKEFKEATERVRKLVWSDAKTGLSIVTPKDVADLRKEGSVLSHCVASYVGPIIKGGHNIMFIRRSDMLDEPYYTLDVDDDGNVLEIHGYRNSEMGDAEVDAAYAETGREVYAKHFDIEGFLSNWCKAMKGKVKKESLKRSYGRLEVVA